MSLLGRSHIKVRAIKDGAVINFDTRKACARHFSVSGMRISFAIENKMLIDGWFIETQDGEGVVPEKAESLTLYKRTAITAIIPDGRRVQFASAQEAAKIMGTKSSYILRALKTHTHKHGSWIWVSDEFDSYSELTDEIKDTFKVELYNGKDKSAIRKTDNDEEPELIIPDGCSVEKGYFVKGENPVICPICHKIVCGTKPTTHLKRCIGDRPYRIKNGVITVVMTD